jgi:hypothetical protein
VSCSYGHFIILAIFRGLTEAAPIYHQFLSIKAYHAHSSEKASPAGPMPEGANGSAYYRDGTSGTGGAGAFLRVSRRLPASTHWCRSDAGYTAGLHEPGTLCLGCIHVRQDYRYVSGTYIGAGYVPHRLWVRQYRRHGIGTSSYSSGN